MMSLEENLKRNKVNSYIGFAVKSNCAIFGLDMLLTSRKPPYIILIDKALGKNSLKQINLYKERHSTVEIIETEENFLNNLLKRENVKILSIIELNLATAIKNNLN
ncbi:MAG: hypothetical protein RR416_01870 [Clostridia bacterium]